MGRRQPKPTRLSEGVRRLKQELKRDDVEIGPVPGTADKTASFGLMAAKALQKDIETTHWVEASERDAKASGDHDRHVAAMKADRKRRLVYLRD